MNREELEERQLEIANRMKNIIWTVCGDYTLEAKPDVEAFLKSKYIALYDGIKQGAFAKYFEKEKLSMYLVKKVYLGAREDALVAIAQLCMEKAGGPSTEPYHIEDAKTVYNRIQAGEQGSAADTAADSQDDQAMTETDGAA